MTQSHRDTARDRRRRIPPPPSASGMEGLGMGAELPQEVAGLLWPFLRAVTLWARIPEPRRARLFPSGAAKRRREELMAAQIEPELAEPLGALVELLARPGTMDAGEVGEACTRIAAWARAQGARSAEVEFTFAAARASGNPVHTLAAARLARDQADYRTAEAWYGRAIGLARRAGDWDTYVRAHVGIGKMWYARGAFPKARGVLQKAVRVPSRKGLGEALGLAYHQLFVIASDSHHDRKAIRYAQSALRAYPPNSPNLRALAYDVAFFWVLWGEFAPALAVLKRVVPHIIPEQQTHAHGGLARTAGAMGDLAAFDAAWQTIWAFDDHVAGKADALVEAARGALSLGRFDDAERAATRGLEIASARRQMMVVFDAEGVLDSIGSECSAGAHGRAAVRAPNDQESQGASAQLAQDLLRSLEAGEDAPNLSEELPGPVATALTRALDDVMRWAHTSSGDPEVRVPLAADPGAAMEPGGSGPDPVLQDSLTMLAERISREAADPEEIAATCARIADWAAENNAPHAALQFAVAAAMVSPEPRRSLAAARRARDQANYPVAETWYQRSAERAERAADWDTYARAYIGQGKMWLRRGAAPAARIHLLKAVETAEREGLREVLGMAYHDLFILASDAHWDADAIAYAAAAARAYPTGHSVMPTLAYDVAYYWVQRGQFARALPVIRAVVPHMIAEHQPQAQGGLARAAGGVGDHETFDVAWQALWALDDQAPGKADGLVEAARGAVSLGRLDEAERAALRGQEIASERGQMRVLFDAEAILGSIRSKRRLRGQQVEQPHPTPMTQNRSADELVRNLVEALGAEGAAVAAIYGPPGS